VRENGTKCVCSEQDEFAEILDERDQRRTEGAKEADHYGRSDERCANSERLKSVLRNVLF
jgi:hypothetical protein